MRSDGTVANRKKSNVTYDKSGSCYSSCSC
jgi:hypothetical protein